MPADERTLNELTEKVIGCAFNVANTLGCGFLEKVYENSLAHELQRNGLSVEQQKCIQVRYDGFLVGEYVADMVIAGAVLVEVKAVKALDEIHVAQCLNYLKATAMRVGLLINFGSPKVEVRRIVNKL